MAQSRRIRCPRRHHDSMPHSSTSPPASAAGPAAHQRAVSSSTRITFTGVPAARFSSAQQRCGRSMRYIVAHMQTTGERKWISCSGCSCFRRLTRCSSVPMAQLRARRGLFDRADDLAGRADHVGLVDHLHHALGMDEDLDAGILLRGTGRRAAAGTSGGRCNALARGSRGCGGSPPACCRRVRPGAGPRAASASSGMPIARAVLRPRCWSGKNSTRLPPGEGPIEHRPGVGRRADDAAVPAAKRLQAGRRVDVGDRHHVVRRRSPRPSCSQQSSTCSMSAMSAIEQPAARSGRTTGHALAAALRPAARAGWPGCRPSRP